MPVGSYTQADILLSERRRLEKPLLLLVWLGTATFSLADGNFFYLAASTLAVLVNFLAARQQMEIFVRRSMANLGVLFATVLIIIEFQTTDQPVLVTIGHYMVLIQLCKLFERKTSRDHTQLIVLNVLLMVTTSLMTTAIWFAVATLAYVLLACYVGMVFTLKRGLDTAGAAALPVETGPLSPRRVAWNVVRDWPEVSLRRRTLGVMLPTLLIAVVAFLFLPRLADRVGRRSRPWPGDGQLDASVRLGRSQEIYLSSRPVMTVRVEEAGQAGPARHKASRYLRVRVLDRYQRSTWRQRDLVGPMTMLGSPVPLTEPDLAERTVRHTITLQPPGGPLLPVPYPTYAVQCPSGLRAHAALDLTYRLTGAPAGPGAVTYETFSLPGPLSEEELAWLRTNRRPPSWRALYRYIQMPEDARRRVQDLARRWCADLLAAREKRKAGSTGDIDLAIAHRLAQRLRNEYSYTLDLRDADPSRDGVEDFLFHLRKGHCEYFASALAVMCCLLDVPARVAIGYTLNEYDDDTQTYTVRGRDAHAWCEVYSEKTWWTLVDATPGDERAAVTSGGWNWLGDWIDSIERAWIQSIVGYDRRSQQRLFQRVGGYMQDAKNALSNAFRALGEAILKLLTEGIVDRALVYLLVILAALAGAIFAWLTLRRLRAAHRRLADPAVRCRLQPLRDLLRRLQRKGLLVESGATLDEQVRRAQKQFGLPLEPMVRLVALQYRWRWGHKPPTALEFAEARKTADELWNTVREQPDS